MVRKDCPTFSCINMNTFDLNKGNFLNGVVSNALFLSLYIFCGIVNVFLCEGNGVLHSTTSNKCVAAIMMRPQKDKIKHLSMHGC